MVAGEYRSRITLLERSHEGIGPARNAGLALARGAFVAFLDSDDLWDPDTLRIQVDVARRHPETGMVVCDGVRFDGDTVTAQQLYAPWVGSRLDAAPDAEFTAWVYRDLLGWSPINCPAQTLVPRHVIDTIGSVCVTPNGPQDYDYYLRIARNYPVTFHAANLAVAVPPRQHFGCDRRASVPVGVPGACRPGTDREGGPPESREYVERQRSERSCGTRRGSRTPRDGRRPPTGPR